MESFDIDLMQFLLGAILASLLAVFAVKKQALTFDGAVGMVILGSMIYGIGGMVWAVPIIYFFISSSLLSKLLSPHKDIALKSFDRAGARNLRQVLANGGIAFASSLLYLVSGWQGWYIIYLASIAEASADTWATEIGTMSSRNPVSILSFQAVEPGRSGAISVAGSTASIAGAVSTVMSGYLAIQLFASGQNILDLNVLIPIVGATVGCLIDSILGATLQAQYRDPESGRLMEKCATDENNARPVRGVSCIDNNIVNLISGAVASIVALALYYLI